MRARLELTIQPALAYGRHNFNFHCYEGALVTYLDRDAEEVDSAERGRCAVIFPSQALDPEPIAAGEVLQGGRWDPISELEGVELTRVGELQVAAAGAPNAPEHGRAGRAQRGVRSLDPVALAPGPAGALVLPVGGVSERGRLDHLEPEQRALHPRRRDLDPEQVEHELLVEAQQLLAGLARRAPRSASRSPRSRSRSPCPRSHLVDPPVARRAR